jgi:hypothetical protein
MSIASYLFLYLFRYKNNLQFCEICGYKKSKAPIIPLVFVVVEPRMLDPGWKNICIRAPG